MKGFGLYLLILVFLLAGVSYVVSQTSRTEPITYLDVYKYFQEEKVDQFKVDGGTLTMHLKDDGRVVSYDLGNYFSVFYEELGETIQEQEQNGTLTEVNYITTEIPWWANFVPYLILIVLLGAFWYFMMNKQSGLLALSGVSSDSRDIEAGAEKGDKNCQMALDMFYYRTSQLIAEMAQSMHGFDTMAFSAGIGENSAEMRLGVAKELEWLGVKIDEKANEVRSDDSRVISTPDSKVKVLVVPTNEEYMIALDVEELLSK